MAGFGVDLEHCDVEIREALFELVERRAKHDGHASRIAGLKKKLGM
jgi:hypothetical protein